MAQRKKPPRRFRFNVPCSDESVLAWIDAQDSLSHSLRIVVREAIERTGYEDVTALPVNQQPRRGRPPKDETQEFGSDSDTESATEVVTQAPKAVQPERTATATATPKVARAEVKLPSRVQSQSQSKPKPPEQPKSSETGKRDVTTQSQTTTDDVFSRSGESSFTIDDVEAMLGATR